MNAGMVLPTLLLLVAAQASQNVPRDAVRPPRVGTAVIRGHVTDADTGSPLPRVNLTLSVHAARNIGETRDTKEAVSNSSGAFEFTRLPAGEYTLSADPTRRATHRPGAYGAVPGKPFGRHSTISLADGEVFEKADIRLQRSYVISGRVVDEDGEPVPDVRVEAEPVDPTRGGSIRSRSTDDRGGFRLWGYGPGTYRVCAIPLSAGPDQRSVEGWVRTCHPSAFESDAQGLTIATADPPEIEIRLRRSRLFRVSGLVIDASGDIVATAQLSFVTVENNGSTISGRSIQNLGGTFTIGGIAPGEYFIRAESASSTDDKTSQLGLTPVSVQASNVENLVVAMETSATVAGRIVFEGGTPPGLKALSVFPESARDSAARVTGRSARPAVVNKDLSFELGNLFGAYTLGVSGAPGWVIKSMRHRGEERALIPTVFRSGPDSGIEIVLTNRTAKLVARVLDERGQPTEDSRVVVFPIDTRQWDNSNAARFGMYREGAFELAGLRAGEYYVAALEPAMYVNLFNRRALEELSKTAERVTLLENDQRSIDLAFRR